jgi:putative SOS response-associated peptidase YedK
MCGRFAQHSPIETLQQAFNIDFIESDVTPNYNIAPTQKILSILKHNEQNHLVKLHWGLVPFWSKDIKIGSRMINARSETVSDKPAFRNAFKKRRCLIIADGFYEWKGEKGHKQPYYITIPSGKPFVFAGLWEAWNPKDNDEDSIYQSCAIITTAASESFNNLHHRMPVILLSDCHEKWLNPEIQDPKEIENILEDSIMYDLQYYPVSKHVNSPKNNDLECIRQITE